MQSRSEGANTIELILKALLGDSVKIPCQNCGAVELVIPVPGEAPIDDLFLANYRCDTCDQMLSRGGGAQGP